VGAHRGATVPDVDEGGILRDAVAAAQ